MNARAASVLRGSVGAGNPHHNITHHCITPRRRIFSRAGG